ncbi:hypothetical protein [Endozoicomonas sp. SCSIO W0465]|uniref:hypothetical protein n=1 Tax=Endozoicomonas sp. SCSIO W0465 TaxID=2918516 RepID=UPI002075A87E|nr:hypothetical protein [Endozoicomonas sp. SCSIO W0465]USE39521.1 hypothetical protein MJO57_15965 [Endozoicomonas sp. SCSIO W0465]
MKKVIIPFIASTILAGCATGSFEAKEAPEGVGYTGIYGKDGIMTSYRTSRKVQPKADLGVCIASNISASDVSFSGTQYSRGALTGNVYKLNDSNTEQAKGALTASSESMAMGVEQTTRVAKDSFGLMNLTYNLKHNVTAKIDGSSLKFKFDRLNFNQANSGSLGAGSFKDNGVVTWIPSIVDGAIEQYNETADRITLCLNGDDF